MADPGSVVGLVVAVGVIRVPGGRVAGTAGRAQARALQAGRVRHPKRIAHDGVELLSLKWRRRAVRWTAEHVILLSF